jgi:hypothetical protein
MGQIASSGCFENGATLFEAVRNGQVSAFELPRKSEDAVLILTVPANSGYTIHVRGKDGVTGVALAEIYEVL